MAKEWFDPTATLAFLIQQMQETPIYMWAQFGNYLVAEGVSSTLTTAFALFMNKTMKYTKEYLVLQCRFYNGQEENDKPELTRNELIFWLTEFYWVKGLLQGQDFDKFTKALDVKKADYDKTPLSLKASLLHGYLAYKEKWDSFAEVCNQFETEFYQEYLSRKTHKEIRFERRKTELLKQCRYYKGEISNPFITSMGGDKVWYWYWEQEWVNALADSYQNKKRFIREMLTSPLLGCTNPEEYEVEAKHIGVPASLFCCFGKNWIRTFSIGFAHEAEENFDAFMWDYVGINYYTQ